MVRQTFTPTFILRGFSKLHLQILYEHPEGLTIGDIQRISGKSKRVIYYNMVSLMKKGLVINIPPYYYLKESQRGYLKLSYQHNIQLHNISFIIYLLNKPTWWENRENRLIKIKDTQFINWSNNRFAQSKMDDFIIQVHRNSLIFTSTKKYYGSEPYECLENSIKDFLLCYNKFEDIYKFKFFKDGIPHARIKSSHFTLLRDALSEHCKKSGDKFEVYIDGQLRLWVDLSDPLGVEAGHKDYAPEDMRRYQDFVRDIITKEVMKPSEFQDMIFKSITSMVTTQQMFDHNLTTHIKAVQDLSKGVNNLNTQVNRLGKQVSRLTQRSLKEWN